MITTNKLFICYQETPVLNLATLYELESSFAGQKKLALLDLMGQFSGDGVNTSCLKFQTLILRHLKFIILSRLNKKAAVKIWKKVASEKLFCTKTCNILLRLSSVHVNQSPSAKATNFLCFCRLQILKIFLDSVGRSIF